MGVEKRRGEGLGKGDEREKGERIEKRRREEEEGGGDGR